MISRPFLAIAVGAGLTIAALLQPEWNFDCVGYAAAARAWLGQPPAEVQAHVKADLAQIAPKAAVKAIFGDSPYRMKFTDDVVSFRLQLPFYSNKPIYIAAVAALIKAGINSVRATLLVSAVAYGALGTLLFLTLLSGRRDAFFSLLGLCLMLAPPIREVGRIGTPDALAAALAFAGFYAAVVRNRTLLGGALLIVSVAARPDSFLYAAAVASWLAISQPARRSVAFGTLILCGLASAIVGWLSGSYSWPVLITHTFIERVTSLDQISSATVHPLKYLVLLARGLRGDFVLHPSVAPLFAIISLLPFISRGPSDRLRCRFGPQGLIWASLGIHFLAFPMLADRFFIAHYLTLVSLNVFGHIADDARSAPEPAKARHV